MAFEILLNQLDICVTKFAKFPHSDFSAALQYVGLHFMFTADRSMTFTVISASLNTVFRTAIMLLHDSEVFTVILGVESMT